LFSFLFNAAFLDFFLIKYFKSENMKLSPSIHKMVDSEFIKKSLMTNGSGNKKNTPKIQAPLPPLKKKMGIVKQSVPPPVPPRGSPKTTTHHSPKSAVTFNNDILMGNVSPGIGALKISKKKVYSNENLQNGTNNSKIKTHKSVLDLSQRNSSGVQNWLNINDFNISVPSIRGEQNIRIKSCDEAANTTVKNLIHNYDRLPKAYSISEFSNTRREPTYDENHVSCQVEAIKDSIGIKQGFVKEIRKSLEDQPKVSNVRGKIEINSSLGSQNFNKIRNEFAVEKLSSAKVNTSLIKLRESGADSGKLSRVIADKEYYV
jgi:hypothetical protein